ncbi:protein hinderin [Notolabrus celidotus]|uniref:protein hinderin n=1 Tax=Notolabrus celidotus TaxID=1203425 RepID=UPI0014904305|nr:protein hinderin [Notolabrus celidotus]
MAAAASKSGNSGIFWLNGVSDDEQPLVCVPGVDGEVRRLTSSRMGPGITSSTSKRGTKMPARPSSDCRKEPIPKKGGKKQGHLQSEHSGAYTKEKVSVGHPTPLVTEHIPFPTPGVFLSSTQVISQTSRATNLVCLKDLCPEDKRRIANLIEELARVSEEKEESVQRLKDGQETFECKIQQLEQQNEIIAQERESLQQQYKECQELLRLYQQYLSEQQAKLNQSIAQLSQVPERRKVLSSEEAPSRANGSLFDGSYLSLDAARAQQPQVSRSGCGGKASVQISSNADSLSCVSEFSPNDGLIKQQRSRRRQCREPHLRCEHCQGSGRDSGYGTQQRRTENGSRLGNDQHHTFNHDECERLHSGNGTGSEAKEARPQMGHEDWEEKRHQLLLQKMQLEMERERLQARLAEQEERLHRQNQQLHASRLDYSRFQQAVKIDLCSSTSRNGDPEPAGPSHWDLPSSVCEEPEEPGRQSLHKKPSQPLDNGNEALKRSKKDMSTSPITSPTSTRKPTSVSAIQNTPEARLDFSVVELLDIFTPASAPQLSKPSTRRPKTSQCMPALTAPKPVGRTLRTPVGPYPQPAQQDLEESRILEDIFFIC